MIEAAKQKLKAGFTKFCIAFTLCAFIGLPLGIKLTGVRGNIEFPEYVIGGGTDKEAQADQTATRYASSLPMTAVTPPVVRTPATAPDGPLPGQKPTAPR